MKTINLTVPQSWQELTQRQLRHVYTYMARFGQKENQWVKVAAACIRRWNNFWLLTPYGDNFLIKIHNWEEIIDRTQINDICLSMRWLSEIPELPVRIDHIDGADAMPPDPTADLTFEQWLACENLYQGYQHTQDKELLRQTAAILYAKEDITLTPSEVISIFYWWASVKQMVSAMFPNFFKPAPASADSIPDADDLRRSVDSQIRALTKGDITKEERILSMSALRALTELDAQAREYDELNKKYPSKS